jgi:hypothetical protein
MTESAKDAAMRMYAAAHDDHALAAQMGDYAANGAAVILLRAYTAEMRDPEPPVGPDCTCFHCRWTRLQAGLA